MEHVRSRRLAAASWAWVVPKAGAVALLCWVAVWLGAAGCERPRAFAVVTLTGVEDGEDIEVTASIGNFRAVQALKAVHRFSIQLPVDVQGELHVRVDLASGPCVAFSGRGVATVAEEIQTDLTVAVARLEVGTCKLTLLKEAGGTGTGTVVSDPEGISCNGACSQTSAQFEQKTVVTLRAAPDWPNYFAGWSLPSCGNSLTCAVPIQDAEVAVKARFESRDCPVDVWCEVGPFAPPTGPVLNAVWGTGAPDVWAAGNGGTVLHWTRALRRT